MKTSKGIGGVIAGVLLMAAGGLLVAFPTTAIFLHPAYGEDERQQPVYLERVTPVSSRIYGGIGLFLGAGLIWLSGWSRWSPRSAAIEDYVWGLSQELSRRFGLKAYYRIEDVTRVAGETNCRVAYIAYAHAMFCSRSDFNTHYASSRVACNYDSFRSLIGRRYFRGASGFDATTLVRLARSPNDEEYDFYQGTAG
jgi:uncharacterized protein DUF6559